MEANGASCNSNVIESEPAEKSDVPDFEGKMQVTARKGTTDQIRRRYANLKVTAFVLLLHDTRMSSNPQCIELICHLNHVDKISVL